MDDVQFCSEQNTSDAKKVPLLNNYGLALHCSSLGRSGCDSQAPKGLWAQEAGTIFGTCAVGIQFLVPSYHLCLGLNTLRCRCVLLVLILEKEKNQAVTLRSRLVKNIIIFSPFYKK